jgi:hypothetical protein
MAVFGVAACHLKIAQPFMAGKPCAPSSKVQPATADFFFRPAQDFFIYDAIPSHEWLGYCRSIPSAVRRGIFVEPKLPAKARALHGFVPFQYITAEFETLLG